MGHALKIKEITSREFRQNQAEYLDLADNGTQIVVKRQKKTYLVTPIDTETLYSSPEIKARLDQSIKSYTEGKTTAYTLDDIKDKLGL